MINNVEIRKINEFLNKFSLKLDELKFDGELFKLNKELYLMNNDIQEMYQLLSNSTDKRTGERHYNNIASAGLYLGKIDTKFKPNFIFLELIEPLTNQKAVIKQEKEFLFLCGRDLTLDSFETNPNTKKEFIVINKNNVVLGMMILENDRRRALEKSNTFYKNIMDKGVLLRREMTNKKTKIKQDK